MAERTSYPPGTFSWVDLQTTDPDAAKSFYGDLLGWTYEDIPIGDDAVYSMAKVQGHSVAAIGPLQGPDMPPHWNCYVTVADTDASAARAGELGANVIAPPFDVFDAGRMAAFADPQGAILSIWQAKENIGAGLVNARQDLCDRYAFVLLEQFVDGCGNAVLSGDLARVFDLADLKSDHRLTVEQRE